MIKFAPTFFNFKNNTMKKQTAVEWLESLPENSGKYIVETKTMMGNTNRVNAYFNGKHWDLSNQTFVKYLKEKQ